jgi:hypothetical protein
MRRPLLAVLGLTASACTSSAVVRVQPAGPDALACVQAELRRLGYTYSPQTIAHNEIHGWRAGGDHLLARVQPDKVGRPTLRLEAFRYSDSGTSTVGDRSVDLGGGMIPPSSQAGKDLAAVAGYCAPVGTLNPPSLAP